MRLKSLSGDVTPAAFQGPTVPTSIGVVTEFRAAVMPLASTLFAPATALANTCTADHAKIDASVGSFLPYCLMSARYLTTPGFAVSVSRETWLSASTPSAAEPNAVITCWEKITVGREILPV